MRIRWLIAFGYRKKPKKTRKEIQMNRLKNSRCYLCGPMDRVPDGGTGWRDSLKKRLWYMGLQWLDPCQKPTSVGIETPELRQRITAAKIAGDYEYVREEMQWIRRVDLRMVHLADFLIVHMDLDVHACGSYEEITWANQQKKPVLMYVKQGKPQAPSWLFGMLPHKMIFSDWESLIGHLDFVNEFPADSLLGNVSAWSDNRWHFFDWMGDGQ